MKTKLISSLLAVLLLHLGMQAQEVFKTDTAARIASGRERKISPGQRQKMADARKEIMDQLNLSEAQKNQMREFRTSQAAELKRLKDDSTLTPEARRAKMKAIREENAEKMKQILTPEQFSKMQELLRERKAQGRRPN